MGRHREAPEASAGRGNESAETSMGSVAEMDLLNEPERAADLPPAEAVRLLVKVEGLAAVLRITAARPVAEPASTNGEREPVCISLEQAAHLSGMDRRAFLRCKVFRPAFKSFGRKRLVVNEQKLRRILESRS